jgi:hypothetical protein
LKRYNFIQYKLNHQTYYGDIKMKELLFGLTALLVATTVSAETTNDATEVKSVDYSKYCYYADVEYPAGSIMEQAGRTVQCVRKGESSDLVWEEYQRNQL